MSRCQLGNLSASRQCCRTLLLRLDCSSCILLTSSHIYLKVLAEGYLLERVSDLLPIEVCINTVVLFALGDK